MPQRRVLLVDDIEHDTIAFQRMVETEQPTWVVVVVDGLERAIEQLGQRASFDVVVGAVRLRTGRIESLLERNLCGGAQTPPLVVLAALGEEELAAHALRAGAGECVVKDAAQGYLTLLPIMLERVLARAEQARRPTVDDEPALRDLRLCRRALADCAVSIVLADATSPDLPLCYVNDAFERLTGYSRAEVLGLNCRMLQGGETDQPGLRELRAALDEPRATSVLVRNYRKDGTPFWNYLTVTPLVDVDGRLTHFMGVLMDVTVQKLVEEERFPYFQFMQHALTPMSMVTLEGDVIFFNPAAAAMIGAADPAQWVGRPVDEFYALEDADRVLHEIMPIVMTEGHWQGESRVRRLDGTLVCVEQAIFAIRNPAGAVIGYGTSLVDIRERKRIELALRESEARYRQMFELHGLPQLIIDPIDGMIEDANPAAARFYGWPVDELRRMTVSDLSLEPGAELLREMPLAASADVMSCFCNQRTAGDVIRSVEVFVGPLQVQGRRLLYAIVTDITEREEAKAALEVARAGLELRVIERTAELAQVRDRLAAILDSSGDGIVALDADLTIVQANRTFGTQFGLSEGQFMGLRMADLVEAEAWIRFSAGVAEARATQQVVWMEAVARRQDGVMFDVEVALAPVSGDTTTLVCSIHDITLRKRAELAVAEERNLLRTVIDTVPAFIYVKDMQHRIVMNNAAHAQSMGLPDPAAAVGKTDAEVFPRELAAKLVADEARLLATGEPILFAEERLMGREGAEIWALTSKAPLRNVSGELIGLVGIAWDITPLKASEAALRASEALYRATIGALSEGIVVQLSDGAIQVCNPAAERILGLTVTQMMGQALLDPRWRAIHEDGSPFPGETHPVMVTLRTGEPQTGVVVGMRKSDGALTWISINSRLVRQEGDALPHGVVATFTDITARRQSEAALRASEERLHLAAQAGRIGIWDWDLSRQHVLWDARMYEIFGLRAGEDDPNLAWRESVHPEDLPQVDAALAAAFSGVQPYDMEFRVTLPGGGVRCVHSMATVLMDGQAEPNRMIGISMDVTARRESEESLQRSLAQERELSELKSRFVSMASHELRTPLAAILATTETLSIYREKMDGDQINARLDRIRQQVMHMSEIVEDVLNLTRLQAGRVEFMPTEGDLSALCEELVQEYADQPGNDGRLRVELPAHPARLMFDRKLLRQAILNLIGNALKYSPPEAAVDVRLTQSAEVVVLSIQDQGIGIPQGDLARVFEPFHRARNVGAISGTGLGLSIAQQAVELHQGTIQINSQVGKGTTVIVTLPTIVG